MSNYNTQSPPQLLPRNNNYQTSFLTYLHSLYRETKPGSVGVIIDEEVSLFPHAEASSLKNIKTPLTSWANLLSEAALDWDNRKIKYNLAEEVERISLIHFLENQQAQITIPEINSQEFKELLQKKFSHYQKKYTVLNGIKSTFRFLVITIIETPLPTGGPFPNLLPIFFFSLLIPFQNYLIQKKLKTLKPTKYTTDPRLNPVQELLNQRKYQAAYNELDKADKIDQEGFIPEWLPLAEAILQKQNPPQLNLLLPDSLVYKISEWTKSVISFCQRRFTF